MPEESVPPSSAPPAKSSQMKRINLPSASEEKKTKAEAKKTKAVERASVKKRKASATSESLAPKEVKTLTSYFENPIDAIPVSSMQSKEIVPFGEDYEIPSGSDEENHSAASSEQINEEIEVDTIPSTPVISSPMP